MLLQYTDSLGKLAIHKSHKSQILKSDWMITVGVLYKHNGISVKLMCHHHLNAQNRFCPISSLKFLFVRCLWHVRGFYRRGKHLSENPQSEFSQGMSKRPSEMVICVMIHCYHLYLKVWIICCPLYFEMKVCRDRTCVPWKQRKMHGISNFDVQKHVYIQERRYLQYSVINLVSAGFVNVLRPSFTPASCRTWGSK